MAAQAPHDASTSKAGAAAAAAGRHNAASMSSSTADGGRSVLIILLRFDLRIHDNALFHYAHRTAPPPSPETISQELRNATIGDGRRSNETSLFSQAEYLIPLYIFDEREIELSGLPGYKREGPEAKTKECGLWKTGAFRTRFISESVYDLRSRLNDRGSDLLIRFGKPENVVSNLVDALRARGDHVEGIWMQKEITAAETKVEDAIRTKLDAKGVPLRFVHGKTLIHPNDLSFPVSETPDVFTPFRKRLETLGSKMVRPTFKAPEKFKPFLTDLPETDDYSLDVTYEVDVDGLNTSKVPETKEQETGQVSFHDILRYLLLPLNEPNLPPTLQGRDLLQQRHPASAFPLRGGESSALERLEWYFIRGKNVDSSRWDRNDPPPVARYKQTRNNLVGHAYSTKMSPFLSYGSVSPRQIWEALDYHEEKFGEDQNTYWVRFELLWRDYFFFVAEKFGDLLFELGGFEIQTDPTQAAKKMEPGWWRGWDPDRDGPENEITRLLEGRTGIPFVDANIIELRESGFMSNRGRQNIASFLSKDLGYDWRIGAEFFQSQLIDYDPTSNYGNWQYVAGVGNDPRASRQFNTIKQAKDYDSHGEYVKMWIPALRNLHPDYVHTPWLLDEEERRRYGLKTTKMDVTLVGYPERPMLELESWKKHYERREGVGSKMRGNPQEKVKDARLRRLKQKTPGRSTGFTAGGQHPHSSPYHHPSTQGGGNSVYPDAQSYDYLASSSGHGNSSEPQKSMLPPLRNLPTPSGQAGRFPTPPVERRGSPFGGPSGSARGSFSNSALSSGNAPGMRAPRGICGGVLSHQSSAPPAVSPGLSGTPTGASKADTEMSWRKPATPSNGGPATGGGSS